MPGPVKLCYPTSVFVSPSNNEVYIADFGNHRIRKILRNGKVVTIAGNGQCGHVAHGDNGPATITRLKYPRAAFVSSNNEVYISDNHIIRKILRDGNIVTIAGGRYEHSIEYPIGLFVTLNDEVYFTDFSHRIRKLLRNGKIVTVAGTGGKGYGGDDGPALDAKLFEPSGVFISASNEIYIADTGNHRIRKVLTNGNIVTIAGNGDKGYGGDSGLATSAQLYNPKSVFVSSNNEIYIADTGNNRIRKILRNGTIVTIAGNGQCKFSSLSNLAVRSPLHKPEGVFVSHDDEVYIADTGNHCIRKIVASGEIVTIAGNGFEGYCDDLKFDISVYPHFGGIICSSATKVKIILQKHSRDCLFDSAIIAFIPLLEKLSPFFCNNVLKNELLISSINSKQQEIIQKLIDYLAYDNEEYDLSSCAMLDVLSILGLFKNNEFIQLKQSFTTQFIESLTIGNLSVKWEELEMYLSQCSNDFHSYNYILEHLNMYCIEFTAIQMKTPGGVNSLPSFPIIAKYAAIIAAKQTLFQPTSVILNEKAEIERMNIETLYNDEKTSDLKIEIGQKKYLYCHKTILSSSSTLFNAMLNSGSTFTDLNNDIFIPDSEDDLELLQIIVKSCYGIQIDNLTSEKLLLLLDMAIKHETVNVIDYCKNHIPITIGNYFEIVSIFETYFHLPQFAQFYDELLRFAIGNRKTLFDNCENVSKLPQKLWQQIIVKLSQEFR